MGIINAQRCHTIPNEKRPLSLGKYDEKRFHGASSFVRQAHPPRSLVFNIYAATAANWTGSIPSTQSNFLHRLLDRNRLQRKKVRRHPTNAPNKARLF